ncbi:MAG: histone deacetylase [Acidobacteria bacterium]|nr:MAG: histone deacetylase [Acidobacteriota bacterium]
MATGFVFHPLSLHHLTGSDHPERPERVLAIQDRLRDGGVLAELEVLQPEPVETRWLREVHSPDYISRVEQACADGRPVVDSADTAISPGSWKAALLAAGGALQAVDRVMSGEWANGFVSCRPPGHHAEHNLAMGFCLFNNVAVAAAYLRARHGLERVAIVDWDVHHGNGTQHIFEDDPSVFYASLHQWPLYPGTGRAQERGRGAGVGATLNCPMDPGAGDDAYLKVMEEQVLPALAKFAPQAILVSAGFDAHRDDPLSATMVTEEGYRRMSRLLLDLAADACQGRLVSMLEGGYDLRALAASVEIHLQEMRQPAK